MPSKQIALPDIKTWELRDRAGGPNRTFEQSELSIESEVRLIQLVGKTIKALDAEGFPWESVATVLDEDGSITWTKASDLLMLAVAQLPEVVAESTAILFGLFPFTEDGSRNSEYEKDKAFLKRNLNFSKWVEILQVFTEQNDYQRLAGPFSRAALKAMETGMSLARERQSMTQNESSLPESTDLYTPDTDDQEVSSDT